MRIGILTFHRAVNYGAVLQAWALQTFLQNCGYEAGLLDYRCKAIEDNYKLFSKHRINGNLLASFKYVLSRLSHIKGILNRQRCFDEFITTKINLLNVQDVGNLDAIITGSDQVWNPFLTGGLDDFYFLNKECFEKKIKIAYAVSGESKYINASFVDKVAPLIGKIPHISVRESNLKDVLQIPNAKVCIDPTFLLSFDEWKNVGRERIVDYDYVFLFEVVPSPLSKKTAKLLSQKLGIKVIFLNSGFKFLKRNSNLKVAVGPDEFVSLIRYSKYVVTTSFHGMALSMLLRKQFVIAPTEHMNRQSSLLKQVGLENRIIRSVNMLQHIDDIKYNDDMFVQLSIASKEFLKSSLEYDKTF